MGGDHLFGCAALLANRGRLLAEAAIETRSASEAWATASRMADVERGGVAFAKTGDPSRKRGMTR
jgi:hypothetical protein